MARIRTIKPEFFTSEDVVSLTPLARLFYVSLWCEADREGLLAWKPRTLKMRYFPADNCDIEAMAQELIQSGMIELYESDGNQYAVIPSFVKHQVINNRESASVLPAPPSMKARHASGTRQDASAGSSMKSSMKEIDASGTRQDATEGKEGKERKERNTRRVVAVGFDDFWTTYPRKVSKGDAEKAFAKLNPDEHLLGMILAAVQRAMTREQWQKDGGRFIPHPATWLNRRGWEDEDVDPAAEAHPSTARLGGIFAGVE